MPEVLTKNSSQPPTKRMVVSRPSQRSAIGGISIERWIQQRDVLRELVARDISLRYKRSVLGQAWTLLNPLTELLVLAFIFHYVLPLGIPHYTAFLFTGLLVYNWFQGSLYYATGAIVNNRELIRRPGIPTAILPVVTVSSTMIHFLFSLPILAGLLLLNQVQVTSAVLLLPVMVALQFTLTLAFAYPLATLNVWFRDTQHLLRVALQLLFYMTPVFYETKSIPERFQFLYRFNPMVAIVEGYRDLLLRGRVPPPGPLLRLTVFSIVMLMVGIYVFRHASHRFADEL